MRVWLFIKAMYLDECKAPLVTQRGTLFHSRESSIYLFFFQRTSNRVDIKCRLRRIRIRESTKSTIKVERNVYNKRRKLLDDKSSLRIYEKNGFLKHANI